MSNPELAPSQRVIVDLFRVAFSGDDAGMRQLCRRVMKRPPEDADHPKALTVALSEVLALAPTPVAQSPLRRAQEAPVASASEPSWDSRAAGVDQPGRRTTPMDAPRPRLDAVTAAAIDDLVAEHRHPAALKDFGLSPTRAALLTGPPGVGKTMSATYIASALELPLITVDIASLMSSFLGRTGRNLQSLIDQALREPSVLLLDEVDAIARSRRDDADIGEVRRVVTVLLQQLDRWPDGGLLIAATNHVEALDDAVLRRFDQIISFPLPDFGARRDAIETTAVVRSAELSPALIDQLALGTDGWSHSDVTRWLMQLARTALLRDSADGAATIRHSMAEAALELVKARSDDPGYRIAFARIAHQDLGMSQRDIAPLLGVSHVTIGNYLRDS